MTPALVIRAMYPNSTSTRGIEGRSRCCSCTKNPEPGGAAAVPGSQSEPDRENQYQDDPGDKLGDDRGRQSPNGDDSIDQLVTTKGRHHSAQNGKRHDDDEGHRGQLRRVGQGPAQKFGHRSGEGDRKAEIPGDGTGDPVPVLDENGTVGAQPGVERVDRFVGGEGAQHPPRDIARHQLRADEDQDADQQHSDEGQARPGER